MKKLYYDLELLAERMDDLRNGDGKNKITLDDLVQKIREKTGEYISKTTLSHYTNSENIGNMRISNLIAIANTYDVSIDYLLGKTKSKMHNSTAQDVYEKFSLSDKSMRNLANLTANKNISNNGEFKIKLINFIIENEIFIDELAEKLTSYCKANDNNLLIKDEIKEKYDISTLDLTRYSLKNVFEKFIDNIYKELWENKGIKQTYLFEMPKERKSKKRRNK